MRGPAAIHRSAAYFLGRLSATLERWDEAERFLEDAVDVNRAIGAAGLVARSEAVLGEVLLARRGPGDAERAEHHLATALDTAERVGMTWLAERIGRALEAARLS